MKTVTTAFTNAWKQKYGKVAAMTVQYKRRYWNGSAYAYESTWQTVQMGQARTTGTPRGFEKVGQITWKLDLPFLNSFKASNVSIYLNNSAYQWLPSNVTSSVFKADATAAAGYEPFLTKFQITFGYQKADGTFELISLLTGVAIDYIFDSSQASVEVVVSGNEFLLQSADAQLVSTAFTDENTTATGDGSTKIFTTTSQGVGQITTVKIAGVTKVQGADYSISGLNSYQVGATITFVTAPGSGQQPTATGVKWKTLQKVEDLIGLLCDKAGITAGQRTINPVVVPNISSKITLQAASDWNAGTLTNIDTTNFGNSFGVRGFCIDDFVSNSLHNWGDKRIQSVGVTPDGSSGYLKVRSDSPSAVSEDYWWRKTYLDAGLSQQPKKGTWQFDLSAATGVSGTGSLKFAYYLLTTASDPTDTTTYNGYLFGTNLEGDNKTYFYKVVNGTRTILGINVLPSFSQLASVWRISIDASGNINVYINTSSLQYSTTDTTFSAFGLVILYTYTTAGNSAGTITVDNIFYSTFTDDTATTFNSTSTLVTGEQNLLAVPTQFGLLLVTDILNGGTETGYTRVASSSGGTYDADVAVSANGQINSALKQYFKARIDLVPDYDTGVISLAMVSPTVSKIVINYSTASATVALANFTAKTCFDAIQRLAQIVDYEWGFDGSGNFFFRSKSVSSTPVLTINQASHIMRVAQLRPGFDAVINDGQVSYNGYYNEYNSSTLPEGSPTSQQRFGTIVLQDDLSDILIANDGTLGAARAQLIHDNNYQAKRRIRCLSKIIPQLDLSDVVSLSFFANPNLLNNIFGDPAQIFGISPFGQSRENLLPSTSFKVIGIIYDLEKLTCDLDLQEVLS